MSESRRSNGLERPLKNLKGVTPQILKDFRRFRLSTTGDLLRVTGAALFAAFKGRVTWSLVRNWRATAALLEIEGMTHARAEALVKDGVLTVRQFSERGFDDLRRLLAPRAPEAGVLARMLTDAVSLHCSGVVMGTVSHGRRVPVRRAQVRIGALSTITDARGRFRVSRIPLSSPATLDVSAKGFRPLSIRLDRTPAYQVTALKTLTLHRARNRRAAAPQVLSELAGDRVPFMTGAPVHIRDVSGAAIPKRELLRVVSINRSKKEARLVSRLQRFDGSAFLAFVYHVRLSGLPEDVAIGQDFRVSRGALVRVTRYSPKRLRAYKRLLRLARAPRRTRPRTRRQVHAAIRRRLREMIASGIFRFSSTGGSHVR